MLLNALHGSSMREDFPKYLQKWWQDNTAQHPLLKTELQNILAWRKTIWPSE